MHMQCANATFTDCDAKACYNYIITIITSLAEYTSGLPAYACILLAKAPKRMECSMVTTYGPSTIINRHSMANPLHGIGQGSTDAPPGWTFNIKQNAVEFVDNNKLAYNSGKNDLTLIQLMDMTRHDITLWDTSLYIDGGQHKLTKTAYNMLVWQYDNLGMPTITPEKDLPVNTVT
eukprot:8051058-Ditylum_brightwellii.AAC.1